MTAADAPQVVVVPDEHAGGAGELRFDLVEAGRIVVFGRGSMAEVPGVLDRIGVRRAQLIVSPSQRLVGQRLVADLGGAAMDVVERVEPRITEELVTATAERAHAAGADVLVCLGGGAAIGLAKATAARVGVGYVAIPTTYSGSEVTDFFGVVDASGRKKALTHRRAASVAIVYDPDLTVALPAALTATSGINAVAQAVGSVAQGDHPLAIAYASEGLHRVQASLPGCVDDPNDVKARTGLLSGAFLCGSALNVAGLSMHHRLVSMLGDLIADASPVPHALLHAALLPHTASAFATADPGAAALLARGVGGDPGQTLFDLVLRVGLNPSLAHADVPEDVFVAAVQQIVSRPPAGSPQLAGPTLESLLYATYRGDRPPPINLEKELT